MALVLQAVIFGAAHANYPGFPAYSRLVELIGPSLIWGLIFLRFGLLPTVILHALFDLVLMSLPIFLVDGPSATANQALVIAAGMVPLAVVLARRARVAHGLRCRRVCATPHGNAAKMRKCPPPASGSAAAGVWAARMRRSLPVLARLRAR